MGEGFGDVAGAGGHVEDAFAAGELRSGDQAFDELLIANPRAAGEGLRLLREFLANNVVVLVHGREILQRPRVTGVGEGAPPVPYTAR
jgi:hypothetical protein